MQQILHIFRKDFRRLWPFVVAVCALFAALALAVNRMEDVYRNLSSKHFWPMISPLLVLAIWALTAALIHEEALVGDRQFWLTRPYSRAKLVAAKALFLAVWVLLPMLAADVAMLSAAGFGVVGNVGNLLWKLMLAAVVIIAPAVCLAVITRSFVQFLLAALGGAAVVILCLQLFGSLTVSEGFGWISLASAAGVLAVATPLIAAIQYWRRRTAVAALSTAATFGLLVACTMLPWAPVFAVQTHVSPRPIGGSEVRATADLTRGPAPGGVPLWGAAAVSLPIRLEHADGLAVSVERVVPSIVTDGDWRPLAGHHNLGSSVQWDGRSNAYQLMIPVKPDFLRSHGDSPLEVRAELYLTVYGNARRHRMAVRAGRTFIPGVGNCFVSDGMGIVPLRVGCMAAFRTADRTRVEIEHPSGRAVRDGGLHGAVTFAPFPHDRVLIPVSLAAAGFRSDALSPELLAESDVVFENWDRVGEVRTQVVITGVRLKEFEVRTK